MKYGLILFLLLFGLYSCKKSSSGPGPYMLQVTINGDSTWSTTNVTTSDYGTYSYVGGTRTETGERINLTIANYSGVNKYTITNITPNITTYGSDGDYVGYSYIRGFEAQTGYITITKVTSNAIYGNFFFENSGAGNASGSFIAPHP